MKALILATVCLIGGCTNSKPIQTQAEHKTAASDSRELIFLDLQLCQDKASEAKDNEGASACYKTVSAKNGITEKELKFIAIEGIEKNWVTP